MLFICIIAFVVGFLSIRSLSIRAYYSFKSTRLNSTSHLLREKEPGFQYVYVEDDGSVWEVSKEDEDYLTHQFHPTDGARPYIKSSYKQKTPDGKLGGFIDRRRVPKGIIIGKMESR